MFHDRFSAPLSDNGQTLLHAALLHGPAALHATMSEFLGSARREGATPEQVHEGILLALGAPDMLEQNFFHQLANVSSDQAQALNFLKETQSSALAKLGDPLALSELLNAREIRGRTASDIAAERGWGRLAKALAPDEDALETARALSGRLPDPASLPVFSPPPQQASREKALGARMPR